MQVELSPQAAALIKVMLANRMREMEQDKSYSNVRCSSTYQCLAQVHRELSK